MGFLDRLLKKPEGGGRTLTLPLSLYGKLPIYKDFISAGLTEDAARELREWLDRGFSQRWAMDDDVRETEIPPHLFLFHLPRARRFVAGSVWGSSDQGGLRRFPFVLFVTLPASSVLGDPLAAADYLRTIDKRASELRDGFGAGASLAAFYGAYRGATLALPARPRAELEAEAIESLADLSIDEFAEALFGDGARAAWDGLLAGLKAACQEQAKPDAVRLPLCATPSRRAQLQFWLLWLLRSGGPRQRPVQGLLFESDGARGRAALFFRDLAPDDILLLHPRKRFPDLVAELGGPSLSGTQPLQRAALGAAAVAPSVPIAVEPQPAPIAVEPEAEPIAVEPQPEPIAVEPQPGPIAPEPQPGPAPEPPPADVASTEPEPTPVSAPEPGAAAATETAETQEGRPPETQVAGAGPPPAPETAPPAAAGEGDSSPPDQEQPPPAG